LKSFKAKGKGKMKNVESKTAKTGNGPSRDTTAKDGPSPMTESKENVSGEIIVGIEKIGNLVGRSMATTLDYIHYYKMPAEKNGQAIWELDLEKFRAWAAALGWTRQMSESELEIQVRKKALQEGGPGKVIEANSLDALAKRLYTDTGRLNSYRKQIDCPIQKNDDGTYRVDLNKWELFQIEYRVGEYFLTGKTKGKVSWT
jgi:hypothetical protein